MQAHLAGLRPRRAIRVSCSLQSRTAFKGGGSDEDFEICWHRGDDLWLVPAGGAVPCASLLRRGVRRQELQRLHGDPHETRLAKPAPLFLHRHQGCQRQGAELVVSNLRADHAEEKRHRTAGVHRKHRERSLGQRMCRPERQVELRRPRHAEVSRRRSAPGRPASKLAMKPYLRYGVAMMSLWCVLSVPAGAQDKEYTIKVMPPGGPAPRLADGHPDLTGHWFPNGAGQGVSGRFGVDPAALGTTDPKALREDKPALQPWAQAKIKAMTPTELELSKSSVNCLPRGVPAIWLQNPHTTLMVHQPVLLAQQD